MSQFLYPPRPLFLAALLPLKKTLFTIPVVLLLCSFSRSDGAPSGGVPPEARQHSYNDAPILFIENKGQLTDEDAGETARAVLFYAGSGAAKVYVTRTGLHYQFSKAIPPDHAYDGPGMTGSAPGMRAHRYSVHLKNANPDPVVRKDAEAVYTERHIRSGDSGDIVAKSYGKLTLENVYPGIDWVLYTNREAEDSGSFKYDFIVKPGADPSLIQLEITDADDTYIDEKGAMVMKTKLGEVKEQPPVSYSGAQRVPTKFKKIKKNLYGFNLGAYDSSRALVIDPEVKWLTYYTGVGITNDISDIPAGSATDQAGNVYLTGTTQSATGIAHNGYQDNLRGTISAFVVKFNPNGERLWATYLGGSAMEFGHRCVTGPDGSLYFALKAHSNDLPATPGAHQSTLSDHGPLDTEEAYDVFLGKLSGSGALLWATYFGGDHADKVYGCATDANGNVYIAGETKSLDLPTDGTSFQQNYSGEADRFQNDAFLAKFSETGQFQWTTYYGRAFLFEHGQACAADAEGNVYLAGRTSGGMDATSEVFQTTYAGGGGDAFLTKFNTHGARLWATFLGGGESDEATACAIGPDGNIYMAGNTNSTNFPVLLPFQATFGGGDFSGDGFLAKFDQTGTLLWSTYYGGEDYDEVTSCTSDPAGNVYLAGRSNSLNGIAFNVIASNGLLSARGDYFKGFVAKFTPGGRRIWGSYVGGNLAESIKSVTTDANHNLYLIGATVSSDLATPGAFKTDNTFGTEAYFIAKVFDEAQLSAPVVYVNRNATGANNGTSWANAYTSLQDALASVCGSANTVNEQTRIWVAKGTYYPDEGAGLTPGDRTLGFELCDKSAVYGGFNGTESSLSERNIAENVTILSGDIDKNNTVDDNNSYNVARVPANTLAAVLDGFTITNGNANIQNCNAYPSFCNGGGLYVANGGSLVLRNIRFVANHAKEDGGGLFSHNSRVPLTISSSIFQQNSARSGGGLGMDGGKNAIVNSLFEGNHTTSSRGGGVYGSGVILLKIINSTIVGNTANVTFGDDGTSGGGIALWGQDEVIIRNTIVWGNSSGIFLRYDTPELMISYSLVQGLDGSSGTGNINGNTNPGFVNEAEGDYQLAIASPVINKGDAGTEQIQFYHAGGDTPADLAGRTRFYGPRIDLGAYELNHISALPVSLANFSAELQENTVLLSWQTTEEVNASHFEVERSGDAKVWETVGQVLAKGGDVARGDTGRGNRYTFRDQLPDAAVAPAAGRSKASTFYYRLRTVDLDGSYAFSSIVSVNRSRTGDRGIALYPNPVHTGKVALHSVSGWTPQKVRVFNVLGKPVDVSFRNGELDASNLPAGLYLVKAEDSDGTLLTLKLLKK